MSEDTWSIPKSYRILVVHPEKQHSFQLATALKRSSMLAGYVTTIYNSRRSLTRKLLKILPAGLRKKALSRRCSELDDIDVYQFCELLGLIQRVFLNVGPLRRWYWSVKCFVEDRFATKVVELAIKKEVDAVISYDGTCARLFELLKDNAPEIVRMLDVSAANALYLLHVYERDIEVKPEFSGSLKDWGRIWNPEDIDRTKREIAASQRFLCGSSFVRKSLEWSGVESERCAVCHYGVDVKEFPFREHVRKSIDEPLTFVYLGYVGEHKGIGYLLDAIKRIDSSKARFVLIGKIGISKDQLDTVGSNVQLAGELPHDMVSDALLEADVMLFPSLGDGFPLSIMEGFSSGLPVVCTENTGSADLIIEGVNGFVVPIQDSEALVEKIEWFLNNRNQLPVMSMAARDTVMPYTWDSYYESIAEIVRKMVDDVRQENR